MKNILINFIIGFCSFFLIKGQNISIPTNYTLSYFKSYDISKTIQCKIDSDCPLYTKCGNYTQNEQTSTLHSICRFENFLCLENDVEPCLYINTTMWSITSQEVKWEYRDIKYKPILKTCPSKRQRKQKKYCVTDNCESDSDCLSGKCNYNSCIFDERDNGRVIYYCSGEEESELIKCGKNGGMKVQDKNECYTKLTTNDFCTNSIGLTKSQVWKIILIISLSFAAVMAIAVIVTVIIHKKKDNKKRENEVMGDENEKSLIKEMQ